METVNWLLVHDGVFGTLAGTVLGAVLGFGSSWFMQWRQGSKERHIAKMQIASNLRHWANCILSEVCDTRTWIESNGHGGTRHSDIRDFRFESSLTQVSILERDLANRLFNLIHEKDDANGKIAATFEYEEEEDALDEFCDKAGKLYGDAVLLYNDIARDLRWPRDAFSERANTIMRGEYERLCALEAQRASFNDKLFEDIGDAVPVSMS